MPVRDFVDALNEAVAYLISANPCHVSERLICELTRLCLPDVHASKRDFIGEGLLTKLLRIVNI